MSRRAVALLALAACVGCDCTEAEFILIATVVDGPTGQVISDPSFGGAAKYAQCQTFLDSGGEGGGAQSMGPCLHWRVHANPGAGDIVVGAVEFVSESYPVPTLADACEAEEREKTFRLARK